jgi:hypothetical protein
MRDAMTPPGSLNAAQMGCTCPFGLNRLGAGIEGTDPVQFAMRPDCPLHGLPKPKRAEEDIMPDTQPMTEAQMLSRCASAARKIDANPARGVFAVTNEETEALAVFFTLAMKQRARIAAQMEDAA